MPQYDIYANPIGNGYLLDVQTDLLGGLNTRIVVPLVPADLAPKPMSRLNPVFDVAAVPHVMATQFLSAVPQNLLMRAVGNALADAVAIIAALDMLTHGF